MVNRRVFRHAFVLIRAFIMDILCTRSLWSYVFSCGGTGQVWKLFWHEYRCWSKWIIPGLLCLEDQEDD